MKDLWGRGPWSPLPRSKRTFPSIFLRRGVFNLTDTRSESIFPQFLRRGPESKNICSPFLRRRLKMWSTEWKTFPLEIHFGNLCTLKYDSTLTVNYKKACKKGSTPCMEALLMCFYLTAQSLWSEKLKRNWKDFFFTQIRNFNLSKVPKLLNFRFPEG